MKNSMQKMMMMPSKLSAVTFLIFCLAALTSLTSSVRQRNSSNRNRNRQGGSNDQYRMICPSVACRPLPETCQRSEYIVMSVPHTTETGQNVEVHCESCEYCLDLPSHLYNSRRAKRSLHRLRFQHDCSRVECPDVTPDCADVRDTDMLLGNTKCKQCPACYDDTIFART